MMEDAQDKPSMPSTESPSGEQLTISALAHSSESIAKLLTAILAPGAAGFAMSQAMPIDLRAITAVVLIAALLIAALIAARFRWIASSLHTKLAAVLAASSFALGTMIGAHYPFTSVEPPLPKFQDLRQIKLSVRGTTESGRTVARALDRHLRPVLADLESSTDVPKLTLRLVVSVDTKVLPNSGVPTVVVPEISYPEREPYKCPPLLMTGPTEADVAELFVQPLEALVSKVIDAKGEALCRA